MNKLPDELQNNIRPGIFWNQEMSGKFQSFIDLLPSAQSSLKNKSFVATSKNLLKKLN